MMSRTQRLPVTRFKNMKLALKELNPFIHMGWHLKTGRPFKRLAGMRSREALAVSSTTRLPM